MAVLKQANTYKRAHKSSFARPPARGIYLGGFSPQALWGSGGEAPEDMYRAGGWERDCLLSDLSDKEECLC